MGNVTTRVGVIETDRKKIQAKTQERAQARLDAKAEANLAVGDQKKKRRVEAEKKPPGRKKTAA